MALLAVKIITADTKAALDTAKDDYIEDNAGLATDLRGLDVATFIDPTDRSTKFVMAIAHNGSDMPASKTEDLAILALEGTADTIQDVVDDALAAVAHHTLTDGNANANAGDISVGSAMFASGDVGRLLTIEGAGTQRTVTAFVSSTRVTYSGAAITGTGLDVTLHGAEHLHSVEIDAMRDPTNNQTKVAVLLALEGQIP